MSTPSDTLISALNAYISTNPTLFQELPLLMTVLQALQTYIAQSPTPSLNDVTGFSLGSPSTTSIPYSFNAATGAIGYTVDYATAPPAYGNAVTLPIGTTSGTITGLTPGTTYTVRVRAVYTNGSSTGVTLSEPTQPIPSSSKLVPVVTGGYQITDATYKRMYGPSVTFFDNLFNINMDAAGTYQSIRFRAPIADTLTSVKLYWSDNAGGASGYAGGTGGTIVATLYADDGTGKPNMGGSTYGTFTIVPASGTGGMSSGVYADPNRRFQVATFTSTSQLTAGAVYHLVGKNTDGSPSTNYSSWDHMSNVTANGPAMRWEEVAGWSCLRSTDSGSTWQDWGSTAHSGELFAPIAEFTTSNGTKFGHVNFESGNRDKGNSNQDVYKLSGSTAQIFRTIFTPGMNWTIQGLSFKIGKISGSGGLVATMTGPTGTLIDTVTIADPGTTYGTDSTPGYNVLTNPWIDIPWNVDISFVAGSAYTLDIKPQGTSVWGMGVNRWGKDYSFSGLCYASELTCQENSSGSWKNISILDHSTSNPDNDTFWPVVLHAKTVGSGGGTGTGPTFNTTLITQDMSLANSEKIKDYESQLYGFYVGSVNQSGARFNMQYQASWDTTVYPSGQYQAVLPWVVLFDFTSNAVNLSTSNVALEIGAGAYYVLHQNGTWYQVGGNNYRFTGGFFNKNGLTYSGGAVSPTETAVTESDGITYTKTNIQPDHTLVYHAWCNQGVMTVPFDTSQAIAVHARLKARLVKYNTGGADNTSTIKLGIEVGADPYVNSSYIWTNNGYVVAPGQGCGRTKYVTNNWDWFTYTSLTDAGPQDPGGQYPRGGITIAQMIANPPPFPAS